MEWLLKSGFDYYYDYTALHFFFFLVRFTLHCRSYVCESSLFIRLALISNGFLLFILAKE